MYKFILKQLKFPAIKRSLFILLLSLSSYNASSSETSNNFGSWVFDSFSEKNIKSCIIYTQAVAAKGVTSENENTSYLYLKKYNEDEFSLGVSFSQELDAKYDPVINIDNDHYSLRSIESNNAHTFSASQDIKLIDKMIINNLFVKIRALGSAKTDTLYFYSLKGFVPALKRLNNCKLQ